MVLRLDDPVRRGALAGHVAVGEGEGVSEWFGEVRVMVKGKKKGRGRGLQVDEFAALVFHGAWRLCGDSRWVQWS